MIKFSSLLLALCAFVFTAAPAHAASEPAAVAEKFYAGYVAQVDSNKDTKASVASSKLVTDKFKKAYAKATSADDKATVVLVAGRRSTR